MIPNYIFYKILLSKLMQIQSSNCTIFQLNRHTDNNIDHKQSQNAYFNKHWQVIQTSIKFFILQRVPVSIVAFQKSLQLLVLHKQQLRIKQQLKLLWRQIFGAILAKIEQNDNNPLISLIQHYKTIENSLKIVFTLLMSYLQTRNNAKIDGINQQGKLVIYQTETVEKTAFNILCQLILKSSKRSTYQRQMILLIDAFRNSSYSNQNVISEETCKNQVRIDLLIVKKIGLFTHLQQEFDQSSKDFFVQLSKQIPKDQNFLYIVNDYLQRQIDFNKIFEPKKNTTDYLQKQLIRQYYDFILDELFEQIINKNDKAALKIFWKFTLRLNEEAKKKFSQKLKKIIISMKRYFAQGNNSKEDIFKVILFRENLFSLTQQCFQKDRKTSNLIYNTFEQVLYEQEKHYLHLALRNIIQEDLTFESNKIVSQGEQQTQSQLSSTDKYFQLFRISPSKQNFIREFQMKFSKWILNKGFQLKSLRMQQIIINQMKKQVGNNLMKKLDRMLNDVWKNNQIYYHNKTMHNGTHMKCLFLSNDWPIQISTVFNIPDQMYNMLNEFQSDFKTSVENKQKSIKWINEIGTVYLSINGIQSVFSQIQAAIIMILDKSIRPLKKQQIQASLNICNMNQSIQNFSAQTYLSQILRNLVNKNILSLNSGPQTYDINDDNKTVYKVQRVSDQNEIKSIKKSDNQKDNSILIEAAIVKIIKKRKNMQKSDITRFIQESIKNFKPSFEQINKAFQKLVNGQYIQIDRYKGIISYVE